MLAVTFFVSPIWIAPLSNSYASLSDKPLTSKINALAANTGISGATTFVKDESRTWTLPNAHIRGLFTTKRIVIFDTAIDQTSQRELLVIVGHEMGHYVHDDLWKLITIQSGLILLGLLGAHWLAAASKGRFGIRWGFISLTCPASLPLLYLSFNLVALVSTPAINTFIRSVEHNADVFALDLTHDNDAALSLITEYAKTSLYVPNPDWFTRNFRMDHPSLEDRAQSLLTYHPWHKNPQGP